MSTIFKAESRERYYPESNMLSWTALVTLGLAGVCYLVSEVTESPYIFLIIVPSFLLMQFFDVRRTLWYIGKVDWSGLEITQERIYLNDYRLVLNGIQNIQIRITYIGEKTISKFSSNTLDILLDDSTTLEYYIVIESQEHLQSLEKAIKYLKTKGVKVDYLDTSKLIEDLYNRI